MELWWSFGWEQAPRNCPHSAANSEQHQLVRLRVAFGTPTNAFWKEMATSYPSNCTECTKFETPVDTCTPLPSVTCASPASTCTSDFSPCTNRPWNDAFFSQSYIPLPVLFFCFLVTMHRRKGAQRVPFFHHARTGVYHVCRILTFCSNRIPTIVTPPTRHNRRSNGPTNIRHLIDGLQPENTIRKRLESRLWPASIA